MPAIAAWQPTPIHLTPHNQTAGLLAKAAWQSAQLDCVHIHCCGNGYLGFRPDGGSLLNSAKVSKTLLPHHSAPRLGSVCPNTGLNPWAAATRHPWRGAANPASCRVTHEFKPAFGQRGLTGRLRSKADQERLASHRGYRLLLQPTKLYRSYAAMAVLDSLPLSQASQLPHGPRAFASQAVPLGIQQEHPAPAESSVSSSPQTPRSGSPPHTPGPVPGPTRRRLVPSPG